MMVACEHKEWMHTVSQHSLVPAHSNRLWEYHRLDRYRSQPDSVGLLCCRCVICNFIWQQNEMNTFIVLFLMFLLWLNWQKHSQQDWFVSRWIGAQVHTHTHTHLLITNWQIIQQVQEDLEMWYYISRLDWINWLDWFLFKLNMRFQDILKWHQQIRFLWQQPTGYQQFWLLAEEPREAKVREPVSWYKPEMVLTWDIIELDSKRVISVIIAQWL